MVEEESDVMPAEEDIMLVCPVQGPWDKRKSPSFQLIDFSMQSFCSDVAPMLDRSWLKNSREVGVTLS